MVNLSHFSLVDTGMYGPGTDMPFYFLNNKSDTLLVTIGDSWTWGSDLTDDDNEQYRQQHTYGSQIANQLGFDLLNLGQRGSNNFWIAQKTKELSDIIPSLAYKRIIVVCMFTEVGRGVNSWYDTDFNFIEWYTQNVLVKDDFYKFLSTINNLVVEQILDLEKFNHVSVIFGTNMVDPIGMEKATKLIRPWFRIVADKLNLTQPPAPIYIMHNIAAEPLKSTLDMVPTDKKEMFLEWIVDLIDQARTSDNLFSNKQVFKDHHPLTIGHTIMSEEIIKEIKL